MSQVIYIGVDDTDTLDSVGTGRVARGLAKRYVDLGLATSLGVSRHQLLVHPEIKYTSHNSSKGLALISDQPEEAFYQPGIEYLKSIFVAGSDPGLCICPESKINKELLDYAVASQKDVIKKGYAISIAAKYGIFLRELGAASLVPSRRWDSGRVATTAVSWNAAASMIFPVCLPWRN
jgi:hypothetical protein